MTTTAEVAVRRVTRAEWQAMPWKNGGGTTHEVWREGSGEPGFALRVSCAEVASDGPFSRFPGVDRVILLLEGAGFVLGRDDGLEVRRAVAFEPFAFRGEERWDCALVAGPVLDLNLMVARDSARADLAVVDVAADASVEVAACARAIVMALDAPLAVRHGDAVTRLEVRDTLVAAGPLALEADSAARAVVIRATLTPSAPDAGRHGPTQVVGSAAAAGVSGE